MKEPTKQVRRVWKLIIKWKVIKSKQSTEDRLDVILSLPETRYFLYEKI